jgi:hypothetical protein
MNIKWKNIPNNFNIKNYILLNPDLINLNEEDATYHYENYGFYEKRKYHFVPEDFDYKEYLNLNPDLDETNEEIAKYHYNNYGYHEKRKYKSIHSLEKNIEPLNDFIKIYNTTLDNLTNDAKTQFRYICFQHINYIKNITLPNFIENSHYECVLIEYRCFPHLEFIIRNNILKLGDKWSHTIICGNLNYGYMVNICSIISSKIKIIKTDYNNLLPSEYSKFLSSLDFWNLLKGKKILICQEDAIIFKNNIEDFLYFDYIGAPWLASKNDNKSCVGNGGLSLRTKDVMIKIINTIGINETKYNSSTLEYIKNTNSFVPPEDVYFTKNMEDYRLGILADRNIASKFSTESIFNDSFGGHNFWTSDKKWKNKLFKYNIFKFKPNYNTSFLEHRGGWKHILNELSANYFFSEESDIDFYDVMEKQFLWETNIECKNKWCGIIHCTEFTPPYLNEVNLEYMFKNKNFIKSLDKCIFIICLSPYLSKYLHKKIRCELNFNIPIYTLTHPVVNQDIILFDMDNFINNPDKMLIQIGQQLRKMTSIYLLNNLECTKMWLTGTKDFNRIERLLEEEIKYLKIKKSRMNKNVKKYYTETFKEYDNLLSNNLVFVDLFDAAANNTVLECIIRNTPIIINKIEGVVDYLGENYPLYFTHLDEVPYLIDSHKILTAHLYLQKMDKTRFMTSTFLNDLYNIINKHFLTH